MIILLRDGTLITNANNKLARENRCKNFVYMGDLKGVAEMFFNPPIKDAPPLPQKGQIEEGER